jgi:MFS transporter, AAHS family, 4-hydroxybenzoate transporter
MTTDVAELIERTGLRRFQIALTVLCGLAVMLDGFDVLVISYVAPALVETIKVSRAMLGPVFSAALIGTTLGALVFAPIADLAGRRVTLVGCLLLFGICSLGTATASSLGALLAWRFVGGLGLGGCAPIAVALLSEFCPSRHRATLVILMYCGYSVGAAGGGLIASWLLESFGWRAAFVVGGVLPLALAGAMLAWLPESVRFLLLRGNRQAEAARVLARIDPQLARSANIYSINEEPTNARFPVGQLFAEGRAARTLLLWLMFFCNILSLYFMTSWFPTLVHSAGVPLRQSVLISTLIQVGSIAGTVLLALVVARRPVFPTLGIGFLFGAVSLCLLSRAGNSVPYLTGMAFLAGFLVIGTQTAANAASAVLYPTAIRSTGVGWALGIGRIGSILGPAIGGALVGLHWSVSTLFLAAAAPAAVAGLLAFAISRLTPAAAPALEEAA